MTEHKTKTGRANVAWRGAIEFAGFPVNVALYSRVKKQRNESFRQIAPSGQPAKQGDPVDTATGKSFDKTKLRKGVEVAKGQYAILTEEAVEQINSGVKTAVAEPAEFVPVDSIDLSLAIERYAVRPDDKVPGSDRAVNIVWNGLRATGKAYVSQISPRGGADAILVVYADDRGMWAALLPFEDELYPVPTHVFEPDAKAEALFPQVVEQHYADITHIRFDHDAYASEYRARRDDAISKVVEGVEVVLPEREEPQAKVPDLMALLEASVKAAPQGRKRKAPEREAVAA